AAAGTIVEILAGVGRHLFNFRGATFRAGDDRLKDHDAKSLDAPQTGKAMSSMERRAHWEKVYRTMGENEGSWFQESPSISLQLIRATGVGINASIIDIGGGAARLVDALLDEGFTTITVL